MAMARELVTEKGIGERADAVWATLQKKQEEMLPTRVAEDLETEADRGVPEIPSIEETSAHVDQLSPPRSAMESPGRKDSRRSALGMPNEQLALF
jgi:hypothetical protein